MIMAESKEEDEVHEVGEGDHLSVFKILFIVILGMECESREGRKGEREGGSGRGKRGKGKRSKGERSKEGK